MPDLSDLASPDPTPTPRRYMPPPPDGPTEFQYPAPKKRPRWAVAVAIGVVGLVIGGIVAGAIAVAKALPDAVAGDNELFAPNPLASGAPQSALAVEPLECLSQCFSAAVSVETIVPQSRLDELGLTTVTEEWGDYASSSAILEYPNVESQWQRLGSETDECFFTLPTFPLATELGTPPAEGDVVSFTGMSTSTDEFSYFTQSVRIFPTSAEAVDHMARLNDLIADCSFYAYDPAVEEWKATVSPAPALAVPDTVAAVGWREAIAVGRYYVVDLQYANLVVRTALATQDVISETQYRAIVEELAAHLAELELPLGAA